MTREDLCGAGEHDVITRTDWVATKRIHLFLRALRGLELRSVASEAGLAPRVPLEDLAEAAGVAVEHLCDRAQLARFGTPRRRRRRRHTARIQQVAGRGGFRGTCGSRLPRRRLLDEPEAPARSEHPRRQLQRAGLPDEFLALAFVGAAWLQHGRLARRDREAESGVHVPHEVGRRTLDLPAQVRGGARLGLVRWHSDPEPVTCDGFDAPFADLHPERRGRRRDDRVAEVLRCGVVLPVNAPTGAGHLRQAVGRARGLGSAGALAEEHEDRVGGDAVQAGGRATAVERLPREPRAAAIQ
jgi:hypothetical protein